MMRSAAESGMTEASVMQPLSWSFPLPFPLPLLWSLLLSLAAATVQQISGWMRLHPAADPVEE
jgi:hypothetical protein